METPASVGIESAGESVVDSADAPAGAHMRTGQMTIEGNLQDEVIRRVVRSQSRRLQACFELQMPESINGAIVNVELEIGSDGRVSSIRASAEEQELGPVERCVSGIFQRTAFPSSEGATQVSFPIVFAR